MFAKAFALAGPPASGKSTLLRVIPSVIKNSMAIDLELFGPEPGFALAVRRGLLDSLLATPRHGILFFGVAEVPFDEFARKGVGVIGLYTRDQNRYHERLRDRNRTAGRPEDDQFGHFTACMDAIDTLRNSGQLKTEVNIFAPNLEGKPFATAQLIAEQLSLPTYDTKYIHDAPHRTV